MKELSVLDTRISYFNIDNEDYISLTDMLKSKDGEIVDDLSFVVLRENKLESYVISLKSNDNGIILQQLASSKETKNKGIIMLILTAYVDNYCKNKYSKITYGILPYNIPSISLKRIFEGYFDIAESAIINYYK